MTDQEKIIALKLEIEKPEYVGMDDSQVAAAINGKTYQVKQDIPTDRAKMAFIDTPSLDWGEVIGVFNGSIPSTQIKVKRATTLVELLATSTPLEVQEDAWWGRLVALLQAMVSDAVITPAGKNAFEALRVRLDPLWMKFELGRPIEWSDVAAARIFVVP